jgi:peptidoglycan/xylan/chitin deacetylase (PgdA/CDA1 family)
LINSKDLVLLRFKPISITFIIVLAVLVILNLTVKTDLLWILVPTGLYILVLVWGSSTICSQFYFEVKCREPDHGNVRFSFDDGPHPEITPRLLKLLSDYRIKASFFCIGKNIRKHPEIVEQISKEGHSIGNHSYSHSFFFDFFGFRKIIDELSETNELIHEITGKDCKTFRPPYGVMNPNIAKALKKLGMQAIGWRIRTKDTVKPKAYVLKKMNKAKPGDIILLHDTSEQTVEILEEFLRSDYINKNK